MEILSQFDLYKFLVIVHIVGTAIGAGGATLSDLLFFKSIEDGVISKQEFNLMHAGGLAIWGGLALLILSGGGIVAYQYTQGEVLFLTSTKLQSKLVIVSIIALNGLLLHTKVFPLFRKSLDQNVTKELFLNHSGLIFTSGAVSATSWYAAMIIGAWRGLSTSPFIILSVYFAALTCAVIFAQIVGKFKVSQIKKKLGETELHQSSPPLAHKTDEIGTPENSSTSQ